MLTHRKVVEALPRANNANLPCLAYSFKVLPACVCCIRRLSNLAGLGMKPTSAPSFTSRPIHQSALNFCTAHRLLRITFQQCSKTMHAIFCKVPKIYIPCSTKTYSETTSYVLQPWVNSLWKNEMVGKHVLKIFAFLNILPRLW